MTPPARRNARPEVLMRLASMANPGLRSIAFASVLALLAPSARAGEPPKPDSPFVKMLKSGRIPEERLGTVFDMIGKRGKVADLTYLFDQVLKPGALNSPNTIKALGALAEAAQTQSLKPEGDLGRIGPLIADKNPATSLSAIKVAGLWKAESLGKPLRDIAASDNASEAQRAAALDAIAAIGGKAGRASIESLTEPGQTPAVRALAVAALTKLDIDEAASRAAEVLQAGARDHDFTPLIAAFLNRQGGSDKLAEALGKSKISADNAKLALRAVYTLGRSDQGLVSVLTKAAGIDADVKPLDKNAMDALIAEVAGHGDAARGELVFRRSDVNCVKCHAVSGAGGSVGPDLSPIGSTSPVDYLINSIVLPDQAIKEVYQTLIVQTEDGQTFQGVVADKDAQRIVLKEATGELRTIATSEIEASKEGGSLMPKGLVNFMTRSEFVDLVRFLSELGKPGPYAIRSTPTIQRWRVLKGAPESIVKSIPDAKTFESEVLSAPEERWTSVYAKAAGDLPLNEVSAASGSTVEYLQADLDVTHGDNVVAALNSTEGVTAWVDNQPAPPFEANRFQTALKTGKHKLTFRVDTALRTAPSLRAEVLKGEGSSAEYVVVGGK